MINRTVAAALEDACHRNAELSTAYKSVSKRTLSRSITTFAASASDQRRELGEALSELISSLGQALLDTAPALPAPPAAIPPGEASLSNDPAYLLRYFRDVESGDKELFAAMALLPGLDRDHAARFSAFSDEARKRSSIAGDHLDLLSLA